MHLKLSVSLNLTDSEIQLVRDFAALEHDDINQDTFVDNVIYTVYTHEFRNEPFIGFELSNGRSSVFVVFTRYAEPELVGEPMLIDSLESDQLAVMEKIIRTTRS